MCCRPFFSPSLRYKINVHILAHKNKIITYNYVLSPVVRMLYAEDILSKMCSTTRVAVKCKNKAYGFIFIFLFVLIVKNIYLFLVLIFRTTNRI